MLSALRTTRVADIGLSDQAAGVVVAINTLGCALGSLLGGWLGDQMAARFPDTGRVWVAQASVLSGILLSVVIFTCVRPCPAPSFLPLTPCAQRAACRLSPCWRLPAPLPRPSLLWRPTDPPCGGPYP